jgi:hypothetical protein
MLMHGETTMESSESKPRVGKILLTTEQQWGEVRKELKWEQLKRLQPKADEYFDVEHKIELIELWPGRLIRPSPRTSPASGTESTVFLESNWDFFNNILGPVIFNNILGPVMGWAGAATTTLSTSPTFLTPSTSIQSPFPLSHPSTSNRNMLQQSIHSVQQLETALAIGGQEKLSQGVSKIDIGEEIRWNWSPWTSDSIRCSLVVSYRFRT